MYQEKKKRLNILAEEEEKKKNEAVSNMAAPTVWVSVVGKNGDGGERWKKRMINKSKRGKLMFFGS